MMIHKAAFISLLILFIAGCANVKPESALLHSCSAYYRTLSVMAVYEANGRLTREQSDQVESIRQVVSPICSGDLPDNPQNALDIVEQKLLEMQGLKAQVEL